MMLSKQNLELLEIFDIAFGKFEEEMVSHCNFFIQFSLVNRLWDARENVCS